MSDAAWTPDELRHFAGIAQRLWNLHGSTGAYYRAALQQLPEGFDPVLLVPFLPDHVPAPTTPAVGQRYLGLARIADC
jgi:hypothetical protein